MKKIYTFLSFVFAGSFAFSQMITVTLQVDISDYLAAGNVLDPNGIRVGGNFATTGASVAAGAMADWTPSDANSAMMDMGNNMWSIEVMYDASAAGSEQLYKFVNGDWGTNEGTDTSAIADGGCGIDDGSGNINRVLTVPTADMTYTFCWDRCDPCNVGIEEGIMGALNVYPNPAQEELYVDFENANSYSSTIELFDMSGKRLTTESMNQLTILNIENLNPGLYLYRVSNSQGAVSGRFVKK